MNLSKLLFITLVSFQIIRSHFADMYLKFTIQTEQRENPLESQAIVRANKEEYNTLRRLLAMNNCTLKDQTQLTRIVLTL